MIRLDVLRLSTRDSMKTYLPEIMDIPDYFGGNLDALSDILSEVSRETLFTVTREDIFKAAEYPFAWKAIRVFILAAEANPYITFEIRDNES